MENAQRHPATRIQSLHLLIGGRVQAVGFRPFVYRLAHAHGLKGWVRNRTGQVEVLVQGPAAALRHFTNELLGNAPPLSQPYLLHQLDIGAAACDDFSILPSDMSEKPEIHVPPDYFACPECLHELRDPTDRRYRYPFINCTQCGPRYTLIGALPYDRPNTAMAGFPLCPACGAEYSDPADRRFHAEPLACLKCGPQLSFIAGEKEIADPGQVLDAAVTALREGSVVAVKGIGGYHLLCDAQNSEAITRLRKRKRRPHKPLAVMFPAAGEDGLEILRCELRPDDAEASLLASPQRPIVLCRRRADSSLAPELAPGLPEIGAMLPYSPLHHLLLDAFAGPLVATSGNLSGEPVLTDNAQAQARLAQVADAFLHHNRPILRPADDPVYRASSGGLRPLRLGRGIAPLELELPFAIETPTLALGGQMKNTIALAWDRRIVISPHIGDLDSPRALDVFQQVIADLQRLYGVHAGCIVSDAHRGYASTQWARRSGLVMTTVLHHHAHASGLYGEHWQKTGVRDDWLVFAWDGTGLGADGTLWGGETLLGQPGRWRRYASLRPFRLPGGERAGREPWRSAMALCWECGVEWSQQPADTELLRNAWEKGLNAPQSSAAGRLFDAAAALLGLCSEASFEGQGPMLLEACADTDLAPLALPLVQDEEGLWRLDWEPLLPRLLDDSLSVSQRAGLLHTTLAQAVVEQAGQAHAEHGIVDIGLTGGVFQNRLLSELACSELKSRGFRVHLAERLPCNDGGLCYGQIVEGCGYAR